MPSSGSGLLTGAAPSYRLISTVFDTGYGKAINVIRTRDCEPPSTSPGHPQALRAHVGLPARRAATLRCACQAGSLAHLRARFDLTTHGKIPAARLGS